MLYYRIALAPRANCNPGYESDKLIIPGGIILIVDRAIQSFCAAALLLSIWPVAVDAQSGGWEAIQLQPGSFWTKELTASRNGNLILEWDIQDNGSVQITFFTTGRMLLHGSINGTGTEGPIPLQRGKYTLSFASSEARIINIRLTFN
jgi:hypothetical protein